MSAYAEAVADGVGHLGGGAHMFKYIWDQVGCQVVLIEFISSPNDGYRTRRTHTHPYPQVVGSSWHYDL